MKKNSKFILLILTVLILIIGIFIYFKTNSYTVNFYKDGTLYTSISVRRNMTMKEPEIPKKEGYIFIGWFNETGESWNFEDKVKENMTLTAGWGRITNE